MLRQPRVGAQDRWIPAGGQAADDEAPVLAAALRELEPEEQPSVGEADGQDGLPASAALLSERAHDAEPAVRIEEVEVHALARLRMVLEGRELLPGGVDRP